MKSPRVVRLSVFALVACACASTQRAPHRDPADGAGVPTARADAEELAERWADLARVEASIATGDTAQARAQLGDLLGSGFGRLAEHGDPAHLVELARRVDGLAARLGLLQVQREARSLLLTGVLRRLPRDDREVIRAHRDLAGTLDDLRDFAGALRHYEHAYDALREQRAADDRELLVLASDVALLRRRCGDLAGALSLGEEVFAARERLLPPDDPVLVGTMLELATVRFQLDDFAGANELDERVLEVRARTLPPEHPDLLAALANVATSRKRLGDLEGALAIQEQVLVASERVLPPAHPDLLAAKESLAVTLGQLGESRAALALLEDVYAARARVLPVDDPELLETELRLASARREFGDPKGALELQEHVLEVRRRRLDPDHHLVLVVANEIVVTLLELDEFQAALRLGQEVLVARERVLGPDHSRTLHTKLNVGLAREGLGDLEGATAIVEQVVSSRERQGDPAHPDLLATRLDLAMIRHRLGDVGGTRALLVDLIAVGERSLPAGHPVLVSAKDNLAAVLEHEGDLAGALALEEEVLAARRAQRSPEHLAVLEAELSAARTRGKLGDLAGAREAMERVLAVAERLHPPTHRSVLQTRLSLGVTKYHLGDREGALALLSEVQSARAAALAPGDRDRLAADQNVAAVRSELGHLAELRSDVASLLEGEVALAGAASLQAPRVARASVVRELRRLGHAARWIETLEPSGTADLDRELVRALEGLRMASTASSEIARAAAAVPELGALREELARVRRALAAASADRGAGAAPQDRGARMIALASRRDALELELRGRLGELGFESVVPTVESMAGALGPEDVLVGFWRRSSPVPGASDGRTSSDGDSLLALVVSPAAEVRRIDLGSADRVQAAVARWRAAIGSPVDARSLAIRSEAEDPAEIGRAGEELRRLVLDPILATFPGAKELRCVLDDVLFLVALDALPLGDRIVGDVYGVRVGTSVREVLAHSSGGGGGPSLLVVGGVDFAASGPPDPRALGDGRPAVGRAGAVTGFAPIPGAAAEVGRVAALFSGATGVTPVELSGASATKAALAERVRGMRYLHVATHGWFDGESVSALDLRAGAVDDPSAGEVLDGEETVVGFLPETLCGLALAGADAGADGILTAEELATLDLSSCELAVLSACETNVGIRRAGQGIQSLQAALHAAGARTAICSLWRVDDVATLRLFELFYEGLWKGGLGAAEALWRAKLALRAEGHPLRDWGGWVLTGYPD